MGGGPETTLFLSLALDGWSLCFSGVGVVETGISHLSPLITALVLEITMSAHPCTHQHFLISQQGGSREREGETMVST